MPETRLEKARATLPEGYQFGDAAEGQRVIVRDVDRVYDVGPVRLERGVRYELTTSRPQLLTHTEIDDLILECIGDAAR